MKTIPRLFTLLTVLALTFGVLGVTPVYAATHTVTNNADSGASSLRAAIAAAGSGDTINFDNDYTITLASQLTISSSMTIDGAGHSVTVSGNHATRTALQHEDQAWVTLMTCEDFNPLNAKYSYRHIVRSVLVSVTAEN